MTLNLVFFALSEGWTEPVDRTSEGQPVSRREYEQVDEFVDAIGASAGVPAVAGPIERLPPWAAAIVLCEPADARLVVERWPISPSQAYSHIFLINAPLRPTSIREVQRVGGAGVIEAARYRVWRDEREDDPDGGVCGRKQVASRLGATWSSNALSQTEDYCFMSTDRHRGLTALLAAYLVAYADLYWAAAEQAD